ncbi:hypothetical protein, partial [Streptomyces sp. NPDC058486]|uniref:hypothetical protein n=1 Tax=Streptomyces sp. NPDC058486 TaxID=3346526 RepID=UPI00364EE0E3
MSRRQPSASAAARRIRFVRPASASPALGARHPLQDLSDDGRRERGIGLRRDRGQQTSRRGWSATAGGPHPS